MKPLGHPVPWAEVHSSVPLSHLITHSKLWPSFTFRTHMHIIARLAMASVLLDRTFCLNATESRIPWHYPILTGAPLGPPCGTSQPTPPHWWTYCWLLNSHVKDRSQVWREIRSPILFLQCPLTCFDQLQALGFMCPVEFPRECLQITTENCRNSWSFLKEHCFYSSCFCFVLCYYAVNIICPWYLYL